MPLKNTFARLCAAIAAASAFSTLHAQALVPDGLDPQEPAAVRQQMQFGAAIAMSGGTRVLVGAPGTDGHGAAYLYVKNENDPKWYLTQKFVAPDIAPGTFGSLVAFDGSVLIADQTRHRVYYFESDGFKYRAKAILRGGVSNFGAAIAMRECIALITSTGDPSIRQPGFVHLFDRCVTSDHTWKYIRSFNPPGVSPAEQFGASIAIDPLGGNQVLVGAPGADNGLGAVYAYSYDFQKDIWVLRQRLVQKNRLPGDVGFGESVSLTINEAVIGAPRARANPATGTSGFAFLFQRSQIDDTYVQSVAFQPQESSGWARFGHKVFIDSNTVAVSAPGALEPVPTGGNLYVYRRSSTPFVPLIHHVGHQRDSRFGADFAAVYGGFLFVGEPFYRTAAGRNEGVATRYGYPPPWQ